jgi:hypothetical protein
MIPQQQSDTPPQPIIFWLIWTTILTGLFYILFFVGGGWPSGNNTASVSSLLLFMILSGAVISTIIRWAVLPRINSIQSVFTTMIIGLALAEGTGILGIFLIGSDFPETQRITFIASVAAILQYIPTYASSTKLAKRSQ